ALAGVSALRYFFPKWDYSLGTVVAAGVALLNAASEAVARLLGPEFRPVLPVVLGVMAFVLYVVYLFLPVIAGALYATLRRVQRERLLRDVAVEAGTGSQRYLEALRAALDSRFEDVGFHLKYAEALFARGQVKEAAVEARLLLHQDPYNFNGNLLLAN